MAHSFNYAILTAIPDPRRGERVNVGIVVFLRDRADIRFSELQKLRALQRGNWERRIADLQQTIQTIYVEGMAEAEFIAAFSALENVIHCSEPGWFSVESVAEYEGRVSEILSALVQRPRTESKPSSSRINTEISQSFRRVHLLAQRDENLDSHKIVRNVRVSTEDDLTADFCLKNGVYHVTATLDLRRANVDKGQAAIKAMTLDAAEREFGVSAQKIGVYAAPHGADQFRPHIHMLTKYATPGQVYNWADPMQRRRYLRSIYEAAGGPAADFTLI